MGTIELLCGVLEVTPTYLMGSKSDDDYATIIGNLMSEPDIPYMNELSAYLSDYYWKLSFVGYVQD